MALKKILVVDDEADIRSLVKVRFKKGGFKCLLAKNGQEAIKIAKRDRPVLIILDLIMPEMDGFEVYKILKADNKTKNIPIITYTAQAPEAVAQKGMKALDVVDFVLKPFDGEALLSLVKKILAKKD